MIKKENEITKDFIATLSSLYPILTFVGKFCSQYSSSDWYIYQIKLAVEEVVINIIKYAYDEENPGRIEITCEKYSEPHALNIIVKDTGILFDPLEKIVARKIEDEGYGIHLYFSIMDQVNYQRDSCYNVLSLFKLL